jgi:tetratricopeptide (TPR) repeat protein
MLALAAIWCAVHEPERRWQWLAAASVAYGLAVGARPSLLFGAVILLVPVVQAWRERRRVWTLLTAAVGPIALIGLGLILYNVRRFDSPFEFGQHYQLAGERQVTQQNFSLRYLWFNFRVYFLEPARWSAHFPFVHGMVVPPAPAGYTQAGNPFGVLTNIPLVWLALAVPLAWRSQSRQAASVLRWFVLAVALLFGMCALTLGLFWTAISRYEVDFLPALLLLAVVGILGWERALAPTSESGQASTSESRQADRVWRHAARWGWGLLLGFSVAFNLLASVEQRADVHFGIGTSLLQLGRIQEAIGQYEQALRIKPDLAEAHYNLGLALAKGGRIEEAINHWEQALRSKPDYAEAHYDLGFALIRLGRVQEAINHWEQVVRINPDHAETQYNLGNALQQVDRLHDAIDRYEEALRIKPDYAEAHYYLGIALIRQGRLPEAMEHWEQAVRINPDYAKAHYNLGVALEQMGKIKEAIGHYEQAVRIKPDYAEAQAKLARLRAVLPER